MDYGTFVDLVQQRARMPSEKSIELIRATLRTLAERVTGGEALNIAAQLPTPLQGLLTKGGEAVDRIGADEFVQRVRDRSGIDEPTVRNGVRAVFVTLREAITGGEFDEVRLRLPQEFEDLFELLAAPGGVTRRQ